jgi:hypothetical protein
MVFLWNGVGNFDVFCRYDQMHATLRKARANIDTTAASADSNETGTVVSSASPDGSGSSAGGAAAPPMYAFEGDTRVYKCTCGYGRNFEAGVCVAVVVASPFPSHLT